MSLLDNLFKSNTKDPSSYDKRLLECIEKNDDGERGVFASIMDDLGEYTKKAEFNDSKMRQMAYAYARRTAAAGLCAQGVWGQEEFDYTYNLFKSFQLETGQTVEFQEQASAQAVELIESYDSRLTKKLQHLITGLMIQDASRAKMGGAFYSLDQLLDIFSKTEQ